ncbi:hypothetical protein [Streptococcus sp.]|uniref:hypothetical protein n=1 Tax=Streptococcus sp. TaxID=1306 RepID=UPI003A8CD9EC
MKKYLFLIVLMSFSNVFASSDIPMPQLRNIGGIEYICINPGISGGETCYENEHWILFRRYENDTALVHLQAGEGKQVFHVEKVGDSIYQIWVRMKFSGSSIKNGVVQSLSVFQIDTNTKRFNLAQFTTYDKNGKQIVSQSNLDQWSYPQPGSLSAAIFDIALKQIQYSPEAR